MSAAVAMCRSKRSFDDLPPSPTSLYLSKKLCCSFLSASSAVDESTIHHFWVRIPCVLSQLRSLFPNMDPQVLERSLQESGFDFEATVKSLNHVVELERQKELSSSAERVEQLPVDGTGWIDLAIGEMTSASSVDDARARAAKLLEGFEKSTSARVSAEIAQTNSQREEENMMLKKQKEALLGENVFLKRFVLGQKERYKEYEAREQELKSLKNLMNEKKEELRKLEVYNYELQLNLNVALKNCSNVPAGRFNPDVF